MSTITAFRWVDSSRGTDAEPLDYPSLTAAFGSPAAKLTVGGSGVDGALFTPNNSESEYRVRLELQQDASGEYTRYKEVILFRRKVLEDPARIEIDRRNSEYSNAGAFDRTSGYDTYATTFNFMLPNNTPDGSNSPCEITLEAIRWDNVVETYILQLNPDAQWQYEYIDVWQNGVSHDPEQEINLDNGQFFSLMTKIWHPFVRRTGLGYNHKLEKKIGAFGLWQTVVSNFSGGEVAESILSTECERFVIRLDNILHDESQPTYYRIRSEYDRQDGSGYVGPRYLTYSPELIINPKTPPLVSMAGGLDGTTVPFGTPIEVLATVVDTDETLTAVYLEYKHPQGTDWTRIPMTLVP